MHMPHMIKIPPELQRAFDQLDPEVKEVFHQLTPEQQMQALEMLAAQQQQQQQQQLQEPMRTMMPTEHFLTIAMNGELLFLHIL